MKPVFVTHLRVDACVLEEADATGGVFESLTKDRYAKPDPIADKDVETFTMYFTRLSGRDVRFEPGDVLVRCFASEFILPKAEFKARELAVAEPTEATEANEPKKPKKKK